MMELSDHLQPLPKLHSIYLISGRRAMVAHADKSIIRLETELFNRTINLTPRDFHEELRKGEIRLIQELSFSTQLQALAGMTQSQMEAHRRRLHYVKFFYERCGAQLPRKYFEILRQEAAELINDPDPFGYTQMHKLCKRYWESGLSEASLIGVQQVFNRRCARLPEELHDIIAEKIEDFYQQETRPSLAMLHRVICGEIEVCNKSKYRTRPLPKPSYGTIRESILRIDIFHLNTKRQGPWAARKLNKRGRPIEYEDRIGARVEADTQLMDVLVVHEEFGITMRPYLTLLLEIATRCIIGWDLSFSHPSGSKTLRALCQAMTRSEVGELRVIPEVLVVDNGSEFINKNVLGLTNDVCIVSRQAAPKSPDQKPFVERVFHTFNQQFAHILPGTTKSGPSHRGDYASEDQAVLTLYDLRKLFNQYLTEIYHNTVHVDLGCAPIVKWRDLEARVPPRTMSEDEARFKTCLRQECSINHGRVRARNMSWESPVLPTLESRLKSTHGKQKAILLIDPNQIGTAWVQDPTGQSPLIEVTSIYPSRFHTFALSEMELVHDIWKEQNKGKQQNAKLGSLDLAALRFYESINEATKNGKRKKNTGKRDAAKLIRGKEKFADLEAQMQQSKEDQKQSRLRKQIAQTFEDEEKDDVSRKQSESQNEPVITREDLESDFTMPISSSSLNPPTIQGTPIMTTFRQKRR